MTNTTTTESVQQQIDQLIETVECDLHQRGILYINRAQQLLSSVKRAQLEMGLCEQVTPSDFFSAKWKMQAKSLGQLRTRLERVICGVRIPIDDHERTVR